MFKSGFISLLGAPNAGKSTLFNSLVGEKLSIITNKKQTTRHKILGMLSDENSQLIFSDNPGIVSPKYEMHKRMQNYIDSSFHDADLFLWVLDFFDQDYDIDLHKKMSASNVPIIIVFNKLENIKDHFEEIEVVEKKYKDLKNNGIFFISALEGTNLDSLVKQIKNLLPIHPPYFENDSLTNKNERFFVSEIIREKILEQYHEEIPYSVEVCIEEFKEEKNIVKIRTIIYVERTSQKGILIGKNASAIKEMSTKARIEIESFLKKKIFLDQRVKVLDKWRNNKKLLDKFSY